MSFTATVDDTPDIREALGLGLKQVQQLLGENAPTSYTGLLQYILDSEISILSNQVFSTKVNHAARLAGEDATVRQKFQDIIDAAS